MFIYPLENMATICHAGKLSETCVNASSIGGNFHLLNPGRLKYMNVTQFPPVSCKIFDVAEDNRKSHSASDERWGLAGGQNSRVL